MSQNLDIEFYTTMFRDEIEGFKYKNLKIK